MAKRFPGTTTPTATRFASGRFAIAGREPKAATKKQPAKRAPAKKAGAADKAINAPRHTAPSRFDTVEDD